MKDLTFLILPELRQMLSSGNAEHIAATLTELHPADIAELLPHLDAEAASSLLLSLENGRRAETFCHLDGENQNRIFERLGPERMAEIVRPMSPDDRADLFQVLPPAVQEDLLRHMAQAERADVKRLLSYPERSAGALMSTAYAALPGDITVADGMAHLRRVAPHRETIYRVMVTDEERRLIGVVSLERLVLARPDARVSEVMYKEPISVPVDMDQEEVARVFKRYDVLAVPVVDQDKRVVGIVTHDDVLDVVQDEATEDALRMGAVAPLDVPYFQAGFFAVARSRAGWLAAFFLGEMFTATVLSEFHRTLESMIALVFFVPLIVSCGGNTGSQSSTLITRAIALGEVGLRDWWRVFYRELGMGLALGLALGAMGFGRALAWGSEAPVAAVVGGTLMAVVLCGSLLGALLPLAFKRLGLDPAITSAPFIASLVDILGIVIYMAVATAVLL